MKDGAVGPDGFTLNNLKSINRTELCWRYNLWLLAGCQPPTLGLGCTVLIPKVNNKTDPTHHSMVKAAPC